VRFGYSHAFFEFSFGVLFVLLTYKYIEISDGLLSYVDAVPLVLQMSITICLGVIFLYDIAHKILPKFFLLAFLLLSLFPLLSRVIETGSYYEFLAPILVALPYFILFLLTLGRGVGFGDVLLFFGVGAILGASSGFLVFLFSLWIGTLTILPLLYFKVVTKKSSIPFAPFIIISYFLVLFTGWDLNTLGSFIYHVML
jgi:prepilin signal peptidase PulO-like enzyme (type II secretory pathway)